MYACRSTWVSSTLRAGRLIASATRTSPIGPASRCPSLATAETEACRSAGGSVTRARQARCASDAPPSIPTASAFPARTALARRASPTSVARARAASSSPIPPAIKPWLTKTVSASLSTPAKRWGTRTREERHAPARISHGRAAGAELRWVPRDQRGLLNGRGQRRRRLRRPVPTGGSAHLCSRAGLCCARCGVSGGGLHERRYPCGRCHARRRLLERLGRPRRRGVRVLRRRPKLHPSRKRVALRA